ncbi:MAG: hypothetical protein IKA25_03150, partial [Alphaproteobacteria bacterium]|nr:hypothetical protein [Alphaproteobacteria bacterium]
MDKCVKIQYRTTGNTLKTRYHKVRSCGSCDGAATHTYTNIWGIYDCSDDAVGYGTCSCSGVSGSGKCATDADCTTAWTDTGKDGYRVRNKGSCSTGCECQQYSIYEYSCSAGYYGETANCSISYDGAQG